MIKILAVYVGCFILASAQAKYCCVPDQWEGVIGLLEGLAVPGKPTLVQGGVRVSYDYTNMRLAEYVNVTVNGASILQKIIIDYNKNTMYTIHTEKQTCTASSPAPKLQRCVPDSARETSSFYFGAGNDRLKAKSYEFDVPSMQLTSVFSLTQDSCIPITEAAYGSSNGVPFLMTLGYVDINPGIRDPSVFNIPSFCKDNPDLKILRDSPKTGNFLLDYLHLRLGFFQ